MSSQLDDSRNQGFYPWSSEDGRSLLMMAGRYYRQTREDITMTREIMVEKLQNAINGMDSNELVQLWNEYTDKANYPDDHIYSMDEFNEIMAGRDPLDIAMSVQYGNFCAADNWFWFDGYGNICTAYRIGDDDENTPVDFDAMIDYIVENGDSLYNDEISDILDDDDDGDETDTNI